MRTSELTPLNLDPTTADTSGDGLRDDRVVDIDHEIRETRGTHELYAEVESAIAHPARVDSTGDGLTDREQIEGWEISVVDDHDAAAEMMSAIADPDRDPDVAEYFETRTVTADPLLNRTAGRLTDAEERSLGTDPSESDTTGDGISDAKAVELDEEDPTVFTTAPPDVTLHEYDHRLVGDFNEFPEWQYEYNYQLEDTSGLESFTLKREGVTREDDDSLPYSISGDRDVRIVTTYTTRTEPVLTGLRGADSEITVEDVYGNSDNVLLVAEQDVGTRAAARGLAPREGGQLSGMTAGLAELPDLFRLVYHEHEAVIDAIMNFAEVVGWDTLKTIIAAMPQSVHESQDQANPYDAPADDPIETYEYCIVDRADPFTENQYCEFATGWYEGYAVYMVIETVVGTKGLSKADTVGDVAKQVRRAGDKAGDARRVLRGGGGFKTGKINHRLVTDGGRDIGPSFRTAGKNARTVKRLEDVDSRILDRLDGGQRTKLLRSLADAPEGHRVINKLGPERTERLFELSFKNVDTQQFRTNLLKHGDEVSDQRLNQYVDDLAETRSHQNIEHPERLVGEAADEGIASSQIRGQAGEARSAVVYADEGADVTVEPGRSTDAYDLSVTRNGKTEYVEVKTRAPDSDVDFNYVSSRISDINNKYDRAKSDSELDISRSNSVLEIRTSSSASDLQTTKAVVEQAISTAPRVDASEIRLVALDGTTRSVSTGL